MIRHKEERHPPSARPSIITILYRSGHHRCSLVSGPIDESGSSSSSSEKNKKEKEKTATYHSVEDDTTKGDEVEGGGEPLERGELLVEGAHLVRDLMRMSPH